jgi:hypothetical protein
MVSLAFGIVRKSVTVPGKYLITVITGYIRIDEINTLLDVQGKKKKSAIVQIEQSCFSTHCNCRLLCVNHEA